MNQTVLFLSHYYEPGHTAAAIRTGRLIEALRQTGRRVILITVSDAPYARQAARDLEMYAVDERGGLPPELPARELRAWGCDTPWPGPSPAVRSDAAIFSVADYLLLQRPVGMILATAPPFSLLAVGQQLAELHRVPLLLDFRDAWHSHMAWPYRNRREREAAATWEYYCVHDAAGIITATETYRKLLGETYGSAVAAKSVTVRHGYIETPAASARPAQSNERRDFTLAYVGQLRGIDQVESGGLSQAVSQGLRRHLRGATFCEGLRLDWMSPHYLMQAMSQCAQEDRAFARQARLVLVGPVYPEVDDWARPLGLTGNVQQRGIVPPAEANGIAAGADVLVVNLYGLADCPYHWCVPSKLYQYLGLRKPILGLLPPGEARDIALHAGLGRPAAPDDVPGIAEALRRLFAEHRAGAIAVSPDEAYIEQFRAERQMEVFRRFLASF